MKCSWSTTFPILDISIRSGDTRESLKLSKIALIFGRFFTIPDFVGGTRCKISVYIITPASSHITWYSLVRLRPLSPKLLLLLLLLMTFIGRKLRYAANAPSQPLHNHTVILEQEYFQSFPEHWHWNVQQTEIGWKTVPHDRSVNGKTVWCSRSGGTP